MTGQAWFWLVIARINFVQETDEQQSTHSLIWTIPDRLA